ncbi:ParB/RepB/Spo0J family partition protein [Mangrovicoccus ximenensis]|uniref:ParB/RepB/Spo0J family partition protein n=1 Tax=Mangrovicoccus ximenensis TaxID=1911570 RepID=UPI001374F52F|nr:ParB N-terminal domain-containing protein [Mangrovicoccus ximenensis]
MARRRLTPAQPGHLASAPAAAPEAKGLSFAAAPPIAKVSGQSAEAAALRELAEGIETARAEGRMIVELPLAEIAGGYLLRDRVHLDREELDALKASIRSHGQRSPAEVTPLAAEDASGARYGLISGWRRLRALGELHEETGENRFARLRALIRPAGEAGQSYVAMIEGNEIRVGLSYYERARVVAETAGRGVFPDQATALRSLFATASRAKRSKIGSFVALYEELGDVLRFPVDIPERLGLALVAKLRDGGGAELRRRLAEAPPEEAADELGILEAFLQPSVQGVSRAKQEPEEKLRDGLEMRAACKGRKITLTLRGEEVDEALLERLRRVLREELGG